MKNEKKKSSKKKLKMIKKKSKKNDKKGFTLVETLAVIVILGIIALIAVPALSDVLGTTNDTYYSSLNKMVEIEAKDYFSDNRIFLPLSAGDKSRVSLDTLVRLNYIEQPVSTKNNPCDGYVEVTKSTKFEYLTCLKCDDYVSDSRCDFSSGDDGNGGVAGSRGDSYLTVSPTYFEVEQHNPFVAPYAKYYYKGELTREDVGATPSYIDTNILTTYTLNYYYLNATPVSIRVKIIDVTPPSEVTVNLKKGSAEGVAYSYDEGWSNSDIYQVFYAEDDPGGSGVKGYEYSFVNQPNNNGVWTFTENNYITQKELLTKQGSTLKDIDTTVYVRAVDNFENKGPVVSYKLRVDQTAPGCASSGGNTNWTTAKIVLTGTCSDASSQCVSNITKDYDTSGEWLKQSPGVVSDKAGNTTTCPADQTVRIDRVNPTVSLKFASQNLKYNTTTTNVTVNASDSASGIKEVCVQLSSDINDCTWHASITNVPMNTNRGYDGGSTTFYAFARDNVGNVQTINTAYTVYRTCSATSVSWGGWGSCNASCGGGSMSRGGSVYDAYFGTYCGSTSQSSSCNTHSCPDSGGGGGTHCCFGGRVASDGGYSCWEAPADYATYANCRGVCDNDNHSWPDC